MQARWWHAEVTLENTHADAGTNWRHDLSLPVRDFPILVLSLSVSLRDSVPYFVTLYRVLTVMRDNVQVQETVQVNQTTRFYPVHHNCEALLPQRMDSESNGLN